MGDAANATREAHWQATTRPNHRRYFTHIVADVEPGGMLSKWTTLRVFFPNGSQGVSRCETGTLWAVHAEQEE